MTPSATFLASPSLKLLRKRLLFLATIMVAMSLVVEGVAIGALYRTGYRQRQAWLQELAQGRARLLEALARSHSVPGAEDPGSVLPWAIEEMKAALSRIHAAGETEELTVTMREDENIVFLLAHRHEHVIDVDPIPFDGEFSEIQRRALAGSAGTMVGRDYRGTKVLAAFEPAYTALGRPIGVVAKIDLREFRAQWVAALLTVAGLTVVLILMGLWIFRGVAGTVLNDVLEEEALHRSIFENALVGVSVHEIITDEEDRPVDYRFLVINKAFEKLTGIGRDDAVGRRVTEVIPGIENGPFIDMYGHVALTGESTNFEHFAEPLDRHFAIFATSPKPRHFAALFVDITDRAKALEEVRAMNLNLEVLVEERTAELQIAKDEMEAFAYSISHDLRVPLRAVDGYANRLKKGHSSQLDEEGRRLLDVVLASAVRMRELVDDILELSRVGRKELNRVPVDMTAMVKSVVDIIQEGYDSDRYQVTVGDLPELEGDPSLLRLVWENLIGNAFKFSQDRDPGRIEIQGEVKENRAVYSVHDNGAGFSMDYADKLLKPFQRLHLVSEFSGTGVGLSIVDRVVQRHGGEVWGEGRVDEGATIWFSIPT